MSPSGLSQVASHVQADFKSSQFAFGNFGGRTLKTHQGGDGAYASSNLADKITDDEIMTDLAIE